MKISLTPVKSSNIEAIGYDAELETLRVRFKSGAEYDYFCVTQHEFELVTNAESVGSAFSTHIKGAGKAFKKLDEASVLP